MLAKVIWHKLRPPGRTGYESTCGLSILKRKPVSRRIDMSALSSSDMLLRRDSPHGPDVLHYTWLKFLPCSRLRLFPCAPSWAQQENMASIKHVMSLIPRVNPPGLAVPQPSSAQFFKTSPKGQFHKALIILPIFVTFSWITCYTSTSHLEPSHPQIKHQGDVEVTRAKNRKRTVS